MGGWKAGRSHSSGLPDFQFSRQRDAVKRPTSLKLFIIWLLLTGVAGLYRGWTILNQMPLLRELEAAPEPGLTALSMVWAAGLLVAGVGLWRRRGWARWATLALVVLFHLTWLTQWLLEVQAPLTRARTPVLVAYMLVATGMTGGYVGWGKVWRKPRKEM